MKTVLSTIFAGALLAFAAAAHAQAKPDPCKADFEKYCPGVKPGGGAVSACYKQNEAALTPACKGQLAPARK